MSPRRPRLDRLRPGGTFALAMVQVECVDFISIPTRNVARAVAWYREVLGLSESAVTEGELEPSSACVPRCTRW